MLDTSQKIMSQEQAVAWLARPRPRARRWCSPTAALICSTAGHVDLLNRARSLGSLLVLGLNSDAGVRAQNKSPERPIVPQAQRAAVVAGLQAVDAVVFFEEPTPAKLIEAIAPDVLVKGGDWPRKRSWGPPLCAPMGVKFTPCPWCRDSPHQPSEQAQNLPPLTTPCLAGQ